MTTLHRVNFQQQKHIFAAVTVIILSAQIQVFKMMHEEPSKAEKAHWNDAEIEALLNYLIKHRSKLASNTFKASTLNEAAADLRSKNLKTHGPMKTGTHCKNKWNTLKSSYNQINKYLQKSGVHWDPMLGANIQGPAAEEAWSDYVGKSSNAGMKPFKNGWKHYAKMQQILMRVSAAHGAAAYNPAAGADSTTETQPVIGPSSSVAGASTSGVGASASGVGASTSGNLRDDDADIATTEDFTWATPPPCNLGPVASTSAMAAPPLSTAKRPHSEMAFDVASSYVTSFPPRSEPPPMSEAPMSEVPRANSDTKKAKFLAQGGGGGNGTNRTCVTTTKKAMKEAGSTAALMNMQGTLNCLSDSIVSSFTVTDESHVSNERSRALQSLQVEEDLSNEEKLTLVHAFMRSLIVCATYLELTQPELRLPFLHTIILEAQQAIPM